ncbi:MAG: hypothetical protein R3280_13915 [Marinobacter sp.]|uniref:hypothetical protein n=1 Tax=Marinobacter sp. TaxID=50741 RepID=UPI00299DEAF7|nr:hypothetical protein [Marinobacter sp.]MDX1635733.1 hypothetical protein [Marinobacter sp.]
MLSVLPFHRIATVAGLVSLLTTLSGCASYYNHYAVFPAANSQGEARKVRLSWQSAEYPGWWFAANQATPVTVTTQCSSREWRLMDAGQREAGEGCGEGIHACGEPGRDQWPDGQALVRPRPCMMLTDADGANRVADLGQRVALTVACVPTGTERTVNGEVEGTDYLRASVVPYQVAVRKAPRGSFSARPPELDDAVCDAE